MARDTTTPSSAISFAKKLDEEVYNFSTQLSWNHNVHPNLSPEQQHHAFLSAISQKIDSILLHQFEESNSNSSNPQQEEEEASSNSNLKQELIHYLQSMLMNSYSSNSNNTSSNGSMVVLTIQQQLAYLLAMYHTSMVVVGSSSNSTTTETAVIAVLEFIHSFLLKKVEYFHQCTSNEEASADVASGKSLFIQSMVFYISFIDYILSITVDRSISSTSGNESDGVDGLSGKKPLFITLRTNMKSFLSAMKYQYGDDKEGEEIEQHQPSMSSSFSSPLSSQSFELFLQEINIPIESKEQLKILYHQDYESFQLLEPFFIHLHSQQRQQQQQQQQQQQGETFSIQPPSLLSNFIRPLPPLSSYSSQVDLFDFDNDYDNFDYMDMNVNPEMKDDEESVIQNQQQDEDLQSQMSDNNTNNGGGRSSSNMMDHHDCCNDLLFFLHPADPFLRFMYMNTTALTTKNEEKSMESSASASGAISSSDGNKKDSNSGDVDQTMKIMSDSEEQKIIQILKGAFTRSLDANVEDEIIQLFNTAITVSDDKTKDVGRGVMGNGTGNNSSSGSSSRNNNQKLAITSSSLFEQMLKVIKKCGLTPENLPKLVKYNHTIANQCLLIILLSNEGCNQKEGKGTGAKQKNNKHYKNEGENNINFVSPSMKKEYLSSLVGMDMSLESMEVVYQLATYSQHLNDQIGQSQNDIDTRDNNDNKNRIEGRGRGSKASEKKRRGVTRRSTTSSSDKMNRNETKERKFLLSAEYVHMFVSNLISSCENTQDRNRQYKYVRLLSVFLQTLIQKDIVQVEVRELFIHLNERSSIILFPISDALLPIQLGSLC